MKVFAMILLKAMNKVVLICVFLGSIMIGFENWLYEKAQME